MPHLSHGLRCLPRLQVAWVPGSFELPVVAKAMAMSGKYDAVVCIGVVVSDRATAPSQSCQLARLL